MKATDKRLYFIRLAVSFLGVAAAVLIVSSVVIFKNYEQETIREYKTISEQMLRQTVYGTDLIWDWASMQAIELYNNGYVFSGMYSAQLIPVDEMNAQNVLSYAMNSNPYIYSIYLYNGSMNRIYSTVTKGYMPDSFYDKGMLDILKDESLLNEYRFIPRRVEFTHYDKTYREDVLSLIVTQPLSGRRPLTGALVLNIKVSSIGNLIESFMPEKDNIFIVYDKDDIIIAHSDPERFGKDISGEGYVARIAEEGNTSGYFIDKVDGQEYLVTYVESEKLHWCFVQMKPYSSLFAKTHGMRNVVLISAAFVFLMALLISAWLSWKLSKPYNKALEGFNKLQNTQQSNRGALKREFLRNLLEGEVSSQGTPEDKFTELGIALSSEPVAVLLLQIEEYGNSRIEAVDEKDAALVRFAVGNIAQEIVAARFRNETVDLGHDQVAVILNLPGILDRELHDAIAPMVADIRGYVEKYFAVHLRAAVGNIAPGLLELTSAYRSAQEVADYRILFDREALITVEMVRDNMDKADLYSDETENDIVNGLKSRNFKAIEERTHEFFSRVRTLSSDDMLMSINRLAYASIKTITSITGKRFADLNYKAACSRIEQMDSLERIEAWFLQMYANFIGGDDSGENIRKKHVARVRSILEQEYGNPDLTSDVIAGRLGLSASYLREIFKEHTGIPLANHLNELRCEKAGLLLRNTDLSVAEISTRVGLINPNYFFTLFKKYQGCTPRQYRDQSSECADESTISK